MVWVRQRTACNMHVHMCTCLCMCRAARCCKGDNKRIYTSGTYAPESVDSEPSHAPVRWGDETKECQRSFLNPPLLLALGDFFGVDSARTGRSSAQMSHAHPSGWHRERYDRLRVPPSGDAHSLADVVRGLGAPHRAPNFLHQARVCSGWRGRRVASAR